MKQAMVGALLASAVVATFCVAPHLSAAEEADNQGAPAQKATQAAHSQATVQITTETEARTGEPAAEKQPQPGVKPATATQTAAQTTAGTTPATEEDAAPAKGLEPVTGAFGLVLGERFEPGMVAKVISQEEKTYRGPDKAEYKGTLYRVEPRTPDKQFNAYSVETNRDGVIYSVRGDFVPDAEESKCNVTKKMAASLADKHGKPRGRGLLGEWYSFRDMTVDQYRGVRLYAPRCRNGRYSIVYSDDSAKMAQVPPTGSTETSGL